MFAPAPFTFAILGVIYILQAIFVLYATGVIKKPCISKNALMLTSIMAIILNLLNIGWLFAWHYNQILISTLIMILILVTLILITIHLHKQKVSGICKLFLNIPFLVYLAWITIATIANITTLLVSVGWDGFGLAPSIWTTIIIGVATLISMVTALYFNCTFYVATIVWALAGILTKHLTTFNGVYENVVYTTIVAMFLMVLTAIFIIYTTAKQKPRIKQ